MKNKILVIGYGDIAKRLNYQLDDSTYEIYGISRQENSTNNFISWDWLSSDFPRLENKEYHTRNIQQELSTRNIKPGVLSQEYKTRNIQQGM